MAKFLVRWREVVWRSAEVEAEEEDGAWDIARETVDPDPFWQEIECQLDSIERIGENA